MNYTAKSRQTTCSGKSRKKNRKGRSPDSRAMVCNPAQEDRSACSSRLLDAVASSYEVESEFEFEGFTCRVLDVPEGEDFVTVAARRSVEIVVEDLRSAARLSNRKPADLAEASGLSESEVRLVFDGHPDRVGLAALHRIAYALNKTLFLEML